MASTKCGGSTEGEEATPEIQTIVDEVRLRCYNGMCLVCLLW
jgi:hypothetical protein